MDFLSLITSIQTFLERDGYKYCIREDSDDVLIVEKHNRNDLISSCCISRSQLLNLREKAMPAFVTMLREQLNQSILP
jgi:hypothetical protein